MEQEQYDLATLRKQRVAIKTQILELELGIKKKATDFFKQDSSQGKSKSFITYFEKGLAIYDGVIMGYKLYNRFGYLISFFRKNKKRRK